MTNRSKPATESQRGFTLTEVLVASAIFTIIMLAALLMYDRSNKVFKSGSESADLQQNTRVAYDKLIADVRMAGFDYKRAGKVSSLGPPAWVASTTYSFGQYVRPTVTNGSYYRCISGGQSHTSEPTWDTTPGATVVEGATIPVQWVQAGGIEFEQPDEQVEYAGATAIIVRANYDYETDPAPYNGREFVVCTTPNVPVGCGPGGTLGLERDQFPVVTTGNDEIVGYALRSVDSAANIDSLTFFADLNASAPASRVCYPGGTAERLVTIPAVDLSNANPPYNLIRFSFAPDGSVVSTPIAENIRSVAFTYFEDTAGLQALRDNQTTPALAPNVGGVGQYNPATPAVIVNGRLIRGKIRSIGIQLVGMNSTRDPYWNDATDTVAPNFRKYELSSVVVPRNLGMFGIRETDAKPPDPPTLDQVCIGFCGIAVVQWSPAPTSATETYTVDYESTPSGAKGSFNAGVLTKYSADLTQKPLDSQYTFTVSARNGAGVSVASNAITVYIRNATTPNTPSTLVASGGPIGTPAPVAGAVDLTWQGPTGNDAGSITCVPGGSTTYTYFPREVGGWRVYRDTDPNFTPDTATNMVYDWTNPTGALPDGIGGWSFSDDSIPSCIDHYYRVQAVEYCGGNANHNDPADVNLSLSPIFPPTGTAAIQGQASAGPKPSAATGLVVDVETVIDPETSFWSTPPALPALGTTYTVVLDWNSVTTDILAAPKVVTAYKIWRQQKQFGVNVPLGLSIRDHPSPGTGPTETYTDPDALPWGDALGPYSYDYYVTAYDCQNSDPSNLVTYPIPCLSNTEALSSAATGDGLTVVGAWVVESSDTFTISHPTATLTSVHADVYDSSNTFIATIGPDNAAPFVLAWPTGMTEGETYRLLITAVDNTSPTPCIQTFTRYAQEEVPIPACTLTIDDPNETILTMTGIHQLRLVLQNTDTENLNLDSIELTYLNQSKQKLYTVTFPSGGAAVLPGTGVYTITPGTNVSSSGTAIVDVTPLPGTLIAADTIVPPSSSINLLINWLQTANGAATTNEFNSDCDASPASNCYRNFLTRVCVKYTRSSTGTLLYSCRIHVDIGQDASTNNPTTCD